MKELKVMKVMKVIILTTHHPAKVSMLKLEKLSDRNNCAIHTSQNESDTNNRKKTFIIGDSIVKNIEGWRLNKRMKSTAHVKSITGVTTKGMMKYHVRRCLEDSFPYTAILHFRANNLKNNKSAEDYATDIMNLAISVKNEIKNCSSLCYNRLK